MEKIKAWFGHSLTLFISTVVGAISLALDSIDLLVSIDFKQQIIEAGFDPVTAGRVGLAISALTFIARLRTLRK